MSKSGLYTMYGSYDPSQGHVNSLNCANKIESFTDVKGSSTHRRSVELQNDIHTLLNANLDHLNNQIKLNAGNKPKIELLEAVKFSLTNFEGAVNQVVRQHLPYDKVSGEKVLISSPSVAPTTLPPVATDFKIAASAEHAKAVISKFGNVSYPIFQ